MTRKKKPSLVYPFFMGVVMFIVFFVLVHVAMFIALVLASWIVGDTFSFTEILEVLSHSIMFRFSMVGGGIAGLYAFIRAMIEEFL